MKSIMFLMKNVPKSVKFFHEGLGCSIKYSSEDWAELESGQFVLHINKVEGEAPSMHGYSPFLCFNVDDMDQTIVKLIGMGASLDGPIKYPDHGKIASLRMPDGPMIGLYQNKK